MKYAGLARRFLPITVALIFCVPLSSQTTEGGDASGQRGDQQDPGSSSPGEQPAQDSIQMPSRSQEQEETPVFQRPIFLRGQVLTSEGLPPPMNTVIERVCAGQVIPEAYTDSNGGFAFEVGRNTSMIADASFRGVTSAAGFGTVSGSLESELQGCRLQASSPGFRSSMIELTGRRALDNPNVGTIILSRLVPVEGYTVSVTTLQAPKKARNAYEKAMKQASKEKWANAREQLKRATEEYPEYAQAWLLLGQIHEILGDQVLAREAYIAALASDDKFLNPYVKLARLDAQAMNWNKVTESTGKVLAANPHEFPDAYYYDALAKLNLRQSAEAEESARKAIELEAIDRFPATEYVLGLALANQNKTEEAIVHLRRYEELVPEASNDPRFQQHLSTVLATVAQRKAEDSPSDQ